MFQAGAGQINIRLCFGRCRDKHAGGKRVRATTTECNQHDGFQISETPGVLIAVAPVPKFEIWSTCPRLPFRVSSFRVAQENRTSNRFPAPSWCSAMQAAFFIKRRSRSRAASAMQNCKRTVVFRDVHVVLSACRREPPPKRRFRASRKTALLGAHSESTSPDPPRNLSTATR